MPVNYASTHPVNPILTGVVSTTRPNYPLIGRDLLPRISVVNPSYSGVIQVDTHTGFMGGPQGVERAPGAAMATMHTKDPSTVSYACKVYSLASDPIPTQVLARSQNPEDLLSREAVAIQAALALAEESRIATLLQTTGNWTATVACTAIASGGGAKWSDMAAGRPLGDISLTLEVFAEQSHGGDATDIVIDRTIASNLRKHPELRGLYILTSGAGQIDKPLTADQLKAVFLDTFGVRLHIGKARWNTANLGQTHTEANIWTDTMWVGSLDNPAMVQAGNDIRASRIAAIGIDETSTQPPSANGAISNLIVPMIAGTEEISKTMGDGIKVWAEQTCCENVLAANLGYTVTDCV